MPKAPTTVGLHGHEILSFLYRYGALTRTQIERLTGLHRSAIERQLGHLVKGDYVLRSRDVAGWVSRSAGRPPTAYYLSLPLGARTGAFVLGNENDALALKHYRRVRLPGTTSHRLLGNEYLIATIEAARNGRSETGAVYSESCPHFPLFGSGTPKTPRADSPYRFSRIVPDGTFTLSETVYLLEVETGTVARKELLQDISNHAGRWRRLLAPNRGEKKFHNPHAQLEPVVILTPDANHKPMRDYLRKHLPDAPDWAEANETIREASGGRAEPGQLIIVAGIDEVLKKDEETGEVANEALTRVYRPLWRYPKELSDPAPSGVPGWRVSLADAGRLAARITVPPKKEVA